MPGRESGNVEVCMNMIREMDTMVREARRAFIYGDDCVINRSELLDRLARLLNSLPDAMNEAEKIVREVQQVRAKTDQECHDILSKAQTQAQQMVTEAQQAAQAAHAEAQQASQQADRIRQEAVRRGQDEAQRIYNQAEQEVKRLRAAAEQECREKVSKENVYRMAVVQADELSEANQREMGELRERTFNYLDHVMDTLDQYLSGLVVDMRIERDELNKHR
ncbi:MAG: hypothetical protein ACI4MJ_02985 [Aristaeellaceae bacterium]